MVAVDCKRFVKPSLVFPPPNTDLGALLAYGALVGIFVLSCSFMLSVSNLYFQAVVEKLGSVRFASLDVRVVGSIFGIGLWGIVHHASPLAGRLCFDSQVR